MINKLKDTLEHLREEIQRDLEEKQREFKYSIEQKRVVFEEAVAVRHRELRMRMLRFMRTSNFFYVLTAPLIYSLIVPLVLLDAFITLYQQVCFRIYGIPLVKRSDYVVMDRKYLGYLNWVEKLNCIYCEYGNGILAYAREIASRTEHFWCPIKHARAPKGMHERMMDYMEYGDGEEFHAKLEQQRSKCRACEVPCGTHQVK